MKKDLTLNEVRQYIGNRGKSKDPNDILDELDLRREMRKIRSEEYLPVKLDDE